MIAIDIEASGTEPKLHSIVSLGAVDLANPERRLYLECRIWDGAHIQEEALRVCGFTEAEIRDVRKPSEADVIHEFIAWAMECDERTFVGQNVSFDRDFIKAGTARAGHTDWPFAYRALDTHSFAYMHMVTRGMTPPTTHHHSGLDLDAILQYCGIPEEPTPHNALTGALCHAEVASRLLYARPLLPEFSQYSVPWV